MTEFGDKSGISPRSKLSGTIAGFIGLVGAIAYGAWTVTQYTATQETSIRGLQWQLSDQGRKIERLEGALKELGDKVGNLQIALTAIEARRRR